MKKAKFHLMLWHKWLNQSIVSSALKRYPNTDKLEATKRLERPQFKNASTDSDLLSGDSQLLTEQKHPQILCQS